jgi:glycosyltransferase involved in cell wall biosynthesis
MRFVKELYYDSGFFRDVRRIGVWFDLFYIDEGRFFPIEAVNARDKEDIKENFYRKIMAEEPQIIHLNSYALDKDCVNFLEDYKRENPGVKIIYTVHSLAFKDFEEDLHVKKLFKGIKESILFELMDIANLHLQNISEEEKERRILNILRKFDISRNRQEKLEKLKIGSYMIGIQKKLMEIADEIVFVSEFLKNNSKSMYNIDGKVIENGVSMAETYEKHKDEIERGSSKWREKYHRDEDIIIGYYIGRTTESEDVFNLIKAFKMLNKEMKNVYVYFVNPHDIDLVAKIAGPLFGEKVFYFKKDTMPVPFRKDEKLKWAEIFKVFDLLVYHSNYEPFGLVPLEAVSCGIPTIVKDVDNLSLFVKEGFCEGFDNKEELYRKMKEILLKIDIYRTLAESKRSVILKKYSMKNTIKKYKSLFENLMDVVLKCPNCGSEMPLYAKYCGHCGYKLK